MCAVEKWGGENRTIKKTKTVLRVFISTDTCHRMTRWPNKKSRGGAKAGGGPKFYGCFVGGSCGLYTA